jgi:hypothetical protein
MQTNHPSRATSSAEYALIVGSGVGAAASLAVQQLAIASLPVTMLVAMGLLNRYRLDHRVEQHLAEDANPDTLLQQPSPSPPLAPSQQANAISHPEGGATLPMMGHGRPGKLVESLTNVGLEALQVTQQKALQSIGQTLQQARAAQQISLEGVHMQTYIQIHQLRAIEAGNLSDLPQPFYIQRLIHKYAQYLGLEAQAIAARFPI